MVEVYRVFASSWDHCCDFSDEALRDMYAFESCGTSLPKREEVNGFLVGKQYMDVNIAMWREDIAGGLLTKHELLCDPTFPEWWITQLVETL